MLLFADGFDHYGTIPARLLDGVYGEINGVSFSSASRTGPRALEIAIFSNNSGLRWVLPGDRDVCGFGYAFNLNRLPTDPVSLAFGQFLAADGSILATITVLPTGAIQWRTGGRNGTVNGTSAPVVRAGSFQHFECNARLDVGAIEVRIDGVTVLSVVSSDATGSCGQVYVAGCYGYPKSGGDRMVIDDLFVRDDLGTRNTGFIGDRKAYTRLPATDGPLQDWTISVGAQAFAMLDNIPPADATDYLTADTAGKKVSVGIAAFPTDIVAISGVYVATRLWKNDAGNAKVSIQVESDGTETDHDPHPMSTAPSWYGDVFEDDPGTAAPWLIADINELRLVINREE